GNVCSCAFPSFCNVRSTVCVGLVPAVVVVELWVVAPLQALSKKRQSKTPLSITVRKRLQNEVCIRTCVLFNTLILLMIIVKCFDCPSLSRYHDFVKPKQRDGACTEQAPSECRFLHPWST